jgi:hypothetical protein
MPYLVATRSFIQNGAVQVKDLWPNVSQRNSVIDPQGTGPIYVHALSVGDRPMLNGSVALGATSFEREAVGLIPYLIATIEAGQDDGAGNFESRSAVVGVQAILSYNEAKQLSDRIFDLLALGEDITEASLNSALDDILGTVSIQDVLGTGGTALSSASISDIVRILAGEKFVVSAGLEIQSIAAGPQYGKIAVLSAGSFAPNTCRSLISGDSSWVESLDHGDLKGFTTLQSYAGQDTSVYTDSTGVTTENLTVGIVAVYDTDGTIVS